MDRRNFLKTICAGALIPLVAKAEALVPTTRVEGCRTNLLPYSDLEDLPQPFFGFSFEPLEQGEYMLSYHERIDNVWVRFVEYFSMPETGPAQVRLERHGRMEISRVQFELIAGGGSGLTRSDGLMLNKCGAVLEWGSSDFEANFSKPSTRRELTFTSG